MKKSKTNIIFRNGGIYLVFLILLMSCNAKQKEYKLPIIGYPEITNGDTIYPRVRDFSFLNQDSSIVTNEELGDVIYIADFFFTSCPTICPKVKQQMIRIYDKYFDDDRIKLVSFTVDPVRDTPSRLKSYSEKLDAKLPKWHFLTGEKDSLHSISGDYMSIALENPDAPGGFDHSGRLILVDTEGHVRAFCNGTDPEEVTEFLKKIDHLLNEG